MSSDPTNKGEMVLFPQGSADLAGWDREEDERNFKRNLLRLRDAFQKSPEIRECLTAHTREERRQGVLHFHKFEAFAPGGQASFERALDFLLHELEQMKVAGHSRYIIDESTGMAVAPLTADLVQTTPDFIDDGGNLRKGRQVVDPGFASALGLAKQERERSRVALEKAKEPGYEYVYEHVRDPESILHVAKERLERAGVALTCAGEASEIVMKIGVEQSDGVFQAPNRNFHRHAMYGALVAHYITTMGHKACEFKSMEKKSDSKSRWYEVRVLVPAQTPAPTPATP